MTYQFDEHSLYCMENYDGKKEWYFSAAMIGTCAPLFDRCESNYDVGELLKAAKVFGKNDQDDSEFCQMFVNFKTKAQGKAFLARLNKFLVKRAAAMEAQKF